MNYKNASVEGKVSSPKAGHHTPFPVGPKMMSSDVIREAKLWTTRTAVSTRRPSTPKDANRELFGNTRGSTSRPPSAFSLSSQHFDPSDPESRPNSGSSFAIKLTPLSKAPSVPANAEPVVSKPHIPMPPSVNKHDLSRRSQSRSLLARKTVSNSQKSPMKAFHPDYSQTADRQPTPPKANRNVHSAGDTIPSPKPLYGHSVDVSLPNPNNSVTPSFPKSHSASTLNINLSNLYDSTDLSSKHDQLNSASSSSSTGSLDQLSISKRKRSGGSGQGTGEETADQAKYWNQNILPLLESLEDTEQEKKILYNVCLELYTALTKGNCLKTMSARRRTSLLSTLFKQLNGPSCSLHLACARIILEMRVRKQNLHSVCRMLFKISREKKMDAGFVENHVLEGMLELMTYLQHPLETYETSVYLAGAIKFLSDNRDVAAEMARHRCVFSIADLLSNTMSSMRENSFQKKDKLRATDILIQVTAVLRSMADLDRQSFVGSNVFQYLFDFLGIVGSDETFTLNVSRLLSKLTMYSEIHQEILTCSQWPERIITVVAMHKRNSDITVRFCFALGNITAKDEHTRLLLHKSVAKHGTASESLTLTNVLNDLLEHHLQEFLHRKDIETVKRDKENTDSCLDVVNKALRVVANLSLSEEVGMSITADIKTVRLIKLILRQIDISVSEELIFNTLTTLNNLSYYNNEDSSVTQERMEITSLLTKIIMEENMGCVTEAVRVFGNISQYPDVRRFLHESQIDLIMVALLDSKKWQVVYSACGVLINMTSDPENRSSLHSEGITGKLLDVLRDFAPTEWRLGGVVCQLLWNLFEAVHSTESSFLTTDEADTLLQMLHTYLDDAGPLKILDITLWEDDMCEYIMQSWKLDFCPVAQRLYKKISLYHTQLEPLPTE